MKLHCWEDRHDYDTRGEAIGSNAWIESYGKPSATCMLEAEHAGSHEWTDDGSICILFAEAAS